MWDVIWSFAARRFSSWHPQRREMLISTRFANTPQLHLLKFPGGARRQLTFLPEPVTGGSFRPKTGEIIVFSQDIGGGEFYQLFPLRSWRRPRDDAHRRQVAQLQRALVARRRWIAYTSTRRNGRDSDIYLMNPVDKSTDRLLAQVPNGGWKRRELVARRYAVACRGIHFDQRELSPHRRLAHGEMKR